MTATDIAPTEQHGTEVAQFAKTVDITSLDTAARLGMWLAAAESGSKDPKALGMAAALRIAYAGSLGLPAHAASEVYVIKGNLTLSSKLLRALAHQHGLRVLRVEETAESCTAAVVDTNGTELGRTTFTMKQAQKMGLSGTNWTNNPDRMLWARASKRALDDFAPWVTVGVLLDDEVQELEPTPFDGDVVLVGEVE
jgi:hypothetical protein